MSVCCGFYSLQHMPLLLICGEPILTLNLFFSGSSWNGWFLYQNWSWINVINSCIFTKHLKEGWNSTNISRAPRKSSMLDGWAMGKKALKYEENVKGIHIAWQVSAEIKQTPTFPSETHSEAGFTLIHIFLETIR